MTAKGMSRERREALAAFFDTHQRYLEKTVSCNARSVEPETIRDACATAWLKLVRRPDIGLDQHGFAWLATIAIYEAWTTARERPETPRGAFLPDRADRRELSEPEGPASDPLDLVLAHEAHRERLVRLACLKPRQQRDLLLHAAGYRYHEIATATHSTYTAVNRHINQGRAHLRRP